MDSFGFRDRSWGLRSQFGYGDPRHPGPVWGLQLRHGFGRRRLPCHHHGLRGDGSDGSAPEAWPSTVTCSEMASGRRWSPALGRVLARDPVTAYPMAVAVDLVDELGPPASRRGSLPQRTRSVPQPQPLLDQLPDRMDLRRNPLPTARTTTTGAPPGSGISCAPEVSPHDPTDQRRGDTNHDHDRRTPQRTTEDVHP